MGLIDWMRERQWRAYYQLDYKQLDAISDRTKTLLENRDFKEVKELVEKYRNSYEAIERISVRMAVEKPVRTPADAADKEMVGLMETLKQTYFMQQEGSRLAAVSPKDAGGIHGMLAMHTFMLDRYLDKHPESDIGRPEKAETDAAREILDKLYEGKDAWQLSQFVLCRTIPSDYVIHRHGLAEDVEKYTELTQRCLEAVKTDNGTLEKELWEQLGKVEDRLEDKAGKALESIRDVRAPEGYLMYLSEELDKLAGYVWNPRRAQEAGNYFLRKHGIRADSPLPQLERQIEDAYKSLDDRIVRLCGRRPYADDLFAGKRKRTETAGIREKPHLNRHPPKQQTKGRKLSF